MRAAMLKISAHARRRMQQRGVSDEQLRELLTNGRIKHQAGGQLVYLDRDGRRSLGEEGEKLARLYAVLDAEGATVVTVGYRTRNLRLH